MHYQLRWIYIVLLSVTVFLICYLYDFQSMFFEISNLQKQKNALYQDLSLAKLSHKTKHRINRIKLSSLSQKTELEKFHDLTNRIHVSGLIIQNIQFLPKKNAKSGEDVYIHLEVLGDIKKWYLLMKDLNENGIQIFIENFSFNLLDKSNLLFSVDFFLKAAREWDEIDIALPIPNPFFCYSRDLNPWKERSGYRQLMQTSASLSQMRMVGYLQQNHRSIALMLLPNQFLMSVNEGAIIGRERGIVDDIRSDHIAIKLLNNNHMIIKMS